MNDKTLKMPFSTFDFFGYIIPGTILLLGLYVHDNVLLNGNGPFLQLIGVIVSQPKDLLNAYLFLLVLFVGMIVAYIMGHIVSAFGSALMDRALIDRVNFYPYVRLMDSLFTIEVKEKFKRRCDKTSLLVLLTLIFLFVFSGPTKWELILIFILFLIIMFKGKVNKRFKEIEKKPDKPTLISTSDSLKERFEELKSLIFRNGVWVVIFFFFNEVTIVGEMVSKIIFGTILSFLRIGHEFPKPFQDLFKKKFEKVYGVEPNDLETNVFWLAASYIIHNLPSNAALAQRAYNFYTLMRNLSMTFFLLLGYASVLHFSRWRLVVSNLCEEQVEKRYYIWVSFTALFTAILFLRYYNTYYNHYTKLVFRSFVTPEKGTDNSDV